VGKLTLNEVAYWLSEAKLCEDRQKIELIKRNSYPFLILYYEGIEKVSKMNRSRDQGSRFRVQWGTGNQGSVVYNNIFTVPCIPNTR
jgi:hypothetical protein